MSVAEFIGDEVSAAGYRLCGIDVCVANEENAMSLIKRACERASLVLISSSIVETITSVELDELLANVKPSVLIVPDIRGLHDAPDIASRIHKQLGMLE